MRLILTRDSAGEQDERITFTEDLGAPADEWTIHGWEVVLDVEIERADGLVFPGDFPSENSFARE